MTSLKFLLYVFIVLVILDFSTSRILDKLFQETQTGMSGGKVNYLIKQNEGFPILAVGNSRCAHHVIPAVLDSGRVYNLSHNGMSVFFQAGLLDQLILGYKYIPDTIILHVDIKDFFQDEGKLEKDLQHLKTYFNSSKWVKDKSLQLSWSEPVKHFFSSYKYNGKSVSITLNFLKTNISNIPTDGYVPKKPTSRDSVNVSWHYDSHKNDTLKLSAERLNVAATESIEHIIRICKENGITLICFTSPVFKPKKSYKKYCEKVQAYFNRINIPYFDYSFMYDQNPEMQNIWLWNDATHLNSDGAKLFTLHLKNDLLK